MAPLVTETRDLNSQNAEIGGPEGSGHGQIVGPARRQCRIVAAGKLLTYSRHDQPTTGEFGDGSTPEW